METNEYRLGVSNASAFIAFETVTKCPACLAMMQSVFDVILFLMHHVIT
jgi:hypothetical protein